MSPLASLTLRLSDAPRSEDDTQSVHLRLADADRLRRSESWDDAIAAYRAAIGAAAPTDRDLLADANRHLGFCLRMAGRLGPAADAPLQVRVPVGVHCRDRLSRLRLRGFVLDSNLAP